MSTLSQLAESLIGSEIVKLGNEISRRIREGEHIFNYTIGDFDPAIFPIPALLEDKIVECYREGFTNYPPADGLQELREAIGHFLHSHHSLSYSPGEIQVASGGRPLIYALFKTIVDANDKVVYAVPSWNNNHYAAMNHGIHSVIQTTAKNNFMPTVDDIRAHISGATLLCLCSPQNPTGTTISKETLEGICDLVLEENSRRTDKTKKLYLMYDQMYSLLVFDGHRHYDPVSLRPAMKDYTIFIDGISKTFAATGVRLGWAAGPVHVLAKMRSLLSHMGAWAPMAEQKATANFLASDNDVRNYLDHFKNELRYRLLAIHGGFMELKRNGYNVDCVFPQAAIYLTVKIDIAGSHAGENVLHTQKDVTNYLLTNARLALVPFSAFGADHHSPWYRMSIGTCRKEEIPDMFALLEQALSQLRVPVA